MTMRVPREELVACPAEALPDGFRTALLHWTNRLPGRLQTPDLGRRILPVGRLRELFGPDAQRLFFREVLGPDRLPRDEIVAAAREKAVARGAKAVPHRLLAARSEERRV